MGLDTLIRLKYKSITLYWILGLTVYSTCRGIFLSIPELYEGPTYEDFFDLLPREVYQAFWVTSSLFCWWGIFSHKLHRWRIGLLLTSAGAFTWLFMRLLTNSGIAAADLILTYTLIGGMSFVTAAFGRDPRVLYRQDEILRRFKEELPNGLG